MSSTRSHNWEFTTPLTLYQFLRLKEGISMAKHHRLISEVIKDKVTLPGKRT